MSLRPTRLGTRLFALTGALGLMAFAAPQAHAGSVPAPIPFYSSACPANIVEGDTGGCVTDLQQWLQDWGMNLAADGDFGPQTLAAVKVFQTEAGDTADGQVGFNTRSAILSDGVKGVQGGPVTTIQHLENAGFLSCLDADLGESGQSPQKAQGWTCNGGSNQNWRWYPVPLHSGRNIIVNQQDNECLDADSGTSGHNGQIVGAYGCNGWVNQQWTTGNSRGQIVNAGDSQCLDADTNTESTNGQVIQTWACNLTQQQTWAYQV